MGSNNLDILKYWPEQIPYPDVIVNELLVDDFLDLAYDIKEKLLPYIYDDHQLIKNYIELKENIMMELYPLIGYSFIDVNKFYDEHIFQYFVDFIQPLGMSLSELSHFTITFKHYNFHLFIINKKYKSL